MRGWSSSCGWRRRLSWAEGAAQGVWDGPTALPGRPGSRPIDRKRSYRCLERRFHPTLRRRRRRHPVSRSRSRQIPATLPAQARRCRPGRCRRRLPGRTRSEPPAERRKAQWLRRGSWTAASEAWCQSRTTSLPGRLLIGKYSNAPFPRAIRPVHASIEGTTSSCRAWSLAYR